MVNIWFAAKIDDEVVEFNRLACLIAGALDVFTKNVG